MSKTGGGRHQTDDFLYGASAGAVSGIGSLFLPVLSLSESRVSACCAAVAGRCNKLPANVAKVIVVQRGQQQQQPQQQQRQQQQHQQQQNQQQQQQHPQPATTLPLKLFLVTALLFAFFVFVFVSFFCQSGQFGEFFFTCCSLLGLLSFFVISSPCSAVAAVVLVLVFHSWLTELPIWRR